MRPVLILWNIVFCLSIIILPSVALAQQEPNKPDSVVIIEKDLIGIAYKLFKLKNKNPDSTRLTKKVQFSILPAATSSPGGKAAVVTTLNAAFYTGNKTTTSLSTATFTPWFTFEGKFVLPFRNLVWFPNNFLLWKGDTRFMVYPQYTWGLGGKNNVNEKILVEYNYVRFYHSFLKKLNGFIFLGAGYDFDFHYNIIAEGDSTLESKLPGFDYLGSKGAQTISSGPVINFLVDSRNNSINPAGGFYFSLDYRINTEFLGSTKNWNSLWADIRKYFPFDSKRQNMIAFWSYYWGAFKGTPPYLDLPSIGWDNYGRSGRGFNQNRYRGKQLVYFETEYRKDITRDGFWGLVVFANLHAVSEIQNNNDFQYWHPAAGAGLRIKFNKISRTNIALDIGVSKDYTGFYLALGEAF